MSLKIAYCTEGSPCTGFEHLVFQPFVTPYKRISDKDGVGLWTAGHLVEGYTSLKHKMLDFEVELGI